MAILFANSGDPDQTLHSAASDLGLHCLPNTLLGISQLQWVKELDMLCRFFTIFARETTFETPVYFPAYRPLSERGVL